MEANHEVEGREVLRPASLTAHKHLSCGKILKILVVGNNIDSESGTLKVMMPDFEAFKDGEKLLVMGVIVMLSVGEGMGVEGDHSNPGQSMPMVNRRAR